MLNGANKEFALSSTTTTRDTGRSPTKSLTKSPIKNISFVNKSSESPTKRTRFIPTHEVLKTTAKGSASNRQTRQPRTCKGYTTSNSNTTTTTTNSRRGNVVRIDDNDDEDNEIFESYMPTTRHCKKPTTTYAGKKKAKSGNFFDDSMDNGRLKCSKCDKEFTEETYNAHTKQCLEDSTITFT